MIQRMTSRSYTPSPSKGKIALKMALSSLIAWHLLSGIGMAHAAAPEQDKSPVFEIKSTISLTDLEKQNEIQAQQDADFAKIDKEVTLVRDYLEANNSPLATYTEYLVAQKDWKKIIAISNSESNMGKHCLTNNCWGIGSVYNLKTYKTMPDAIADVQALIDKRYENMTLNQMDGVYVQPRSTNWLMASTKVYNDLSEIEKQFNSDSDSSVTTASTTGATGMVQIASIQQ